MAEGPRRPGTGNVRHGRSKLLVHRYRIVYLFFEDEPGIQLSRWLRRNRSLSDREQV